MSATGPFPEDDELRQAELKTLKSRRRLYSGIYVIVLCALLYLLGRVLNLLAAPMGIIVWTTIIVFCLRGPVNYLDKKGVPRVLGTLLAYILMCAVLFLMGWLLLSPAMGIGEQFTACHCCRRFPTRSPPSGTLGTTCMASMPTCCRMNASTAGSTTLSRASAPGSRAWLPQVPKV